MTEASPVTHMGFLQPELYQPDSVGAPVAQTECRVVDEKENDVAPGEIGELVMRGPQFMLGYWKSPDASAAVLARWMVLDWRHCAGGRQRPVLRGRSAQGDDEVQGLLDCAGRGGKRAARASRGARLRRGFTSRQLRAKRFPAPSWFCAKGEPATSRPRHGCRNSWLTALPTTKCRAKSISCRRCPARRQAKSCGASCASSCKQPSPGNSQRLVIPGTPPFGGFLYTKHGLLRPALRRHHGRHMQNQKRTFLVLIACF